MKRFLQSILPRQLEPLARSARNALRACITPLRYSRGARFARSWSGRNEAAFVDVEAKNAFMLRASFNPLWTYFTNHKEGHGIWKWEHYFDIYHRHFSKFIGTTVNVAEIGIYSGGSLDMWAAYFGDKSTVYGIDIQEACKAYERDNIRIFIGDQASPQFWAHFKSKAAALDILVDDGGHTPEQQMVTLEQMLPFLSPGGVYLCEDVHGIHHGFAAFAAGLVSELNRMSRWSEDGSKPTNFQSECHSIHFYPFAIVIEKHAISPERLVAPKHGTLWQPFNASTDRIGL